MEDKDIVKIVQVILSINELTKKIGIERVVEEYDDIIIGINNPLISYGYCRITNGKTKRFKENEQIVLNANDPEISYLFCRYVIP